MDEDMVPLMGRGCAEVSVEASRARALRKGFLEVAPFWLPVALCL